MLKSLMQGWPFRESVLEAGTAATGSTMFFSEDKRDDCGEVEKIITLQVSFLSRRESLSCRAQRKEIPSRNVGTE
jgi:hypothetical protein